MLLSITFGDKAHRHTWSACYPCPVQAGSVPPGRHPLQHQAPDNPCSGFVRVFGDFTRFPHVRLQPLGSRTTSQASLFRPLVAYAVRAQRLALVCKLPLLNPGPNRAPWLRPQAPTSFPWVEARFSATLVASHRLASNLSVPAALPVSFIHLLPDSLRPCEFGRVLGLHATPVRFWLKQRPLVVIPGFCILEAARRRGFFVFIRVGRDFSWLSPVPVTSVSP